MTTSHPIEFSPQSPEWHGGDDKNGVIKVVMTGAVRGVLAKPLTAEEAQVETTEQAIKQLVSKAVASEGVVDIFTAAGLEKPDVSILSDEFLTEVRDLPHKNVAVELLVGTVSEPRQP